MFERWWWRRRPHPGGRSSRTKFSHTNKRRCFTHPLAIIGRWFFYNVMCLTHDLNPFFAAQGSTAGRNANSARTHFKWYKGERSTGFADVQNNNNNNSSTKGSGPTFRKTSFRLRCTRINKRARERNTCKGITVRRRFDTHTHKLTTHCKN